MPEWVAALFAAHQKRQASGCSTPNSISGVVLEPSVEPATAGSRSSVLRAASSASSLTPQQQVSNGLSRWASLLYPTKEERQKMSATVKAVKEELERVCMTKPYKVLQVEAVGSHAKRTSLRNT
jgi:hypothetical protein